MADVALRDIQNYVYNHDTEPDLVEAAACVANAIAVGAGGFIQGSLMEANLRDALGLKRGELVNIPKPSTVGDSHVGK